MQPLLTEMVYLRDASWATFMMMRTMHSSRVLGTGRKTYDSPLVYDRTDTHREVGGLRPFWAPVEYKDYGKGSG